MNGGISKRNRKGVPPLLHFDHFDVCDLLISGLKVKPLKVRRATNLFEFSFLVLKLVVLVIFWDLVVSWNLRWDEKYSPGIHALSRPLLGFSRTDHLSIVI